MSNPMKEIITKKILEMVGDNRKDFKNGTFLEHRDEYNKGYNQALSDIRNKAPHLAESIVEDMDKEIEKMQVTSEFIENQDLKAGFQIALKVIFDLLEVKEK